MVVDTSAVIAILFGEDDSHLYEDAITGASRTTMSAANLIEASMVACGADEKLEPLLDKLLAQLGIQTSPVDLAQVALAREAFRRFGKGRHKARINLGDTFAYALAMHLDEPLLYKGDDFARTDVRSALAA